MEIAASLAGLPAFALYFLGAALLTLGYATVYMRVTAHDELALINAGSAAAAAGFAGSFLGFVVPLASAIAHSVSAVDAFVWGLVALVVQVATYLLLRAVFAGIGQRIVAGQVAAGVQLGVISLGAGLLQAACMSY